MDTFVSAFASIRERLLDPPTPDSDAGAVAFLMADVRIGEAEAVAPCVSRFVVAELRPSQDTKPVGR
ncbi:MAG: hypothetical protein ACXWP0_19940 [Ktedonobacterales bacterium]